MRVKVPVLPSVDVGPLLKPGWKLNWAQIAFFAVGLVVHRSGRLVVLAFSLVGFCKVR